MYWLGSNEQKDMPILPRDPTFPLFWIYLQRHTRAVFTWLLTAISPRFRWTQDHKPVQRKCKPPTQRNLKNPVHIAARCITLSWLMGAAGHTEQYWPLLSGRRYISKTTVRKVQALVKYQAQHSPNPVPLFVFSSHTPLTCFALVSSIHQH
jgi:hypothetical protein